jgi:threonyl-tRNA synthetase
VVLTGTKSLPHAAGDAMSPRAAMQCGEPQPKGRFSMPAIILPDGSVRQFDAPVTGTTVAEAIGPGLARAALAMKLDGKTVDLSTWIDRDANVVFVTRRDDDALELIRHDAAHVLAEAVQELFPGTQVTIGPAIENGFYYDFARNEPFTPEDFPAIEAKMKEIVVRGAPFVRSVMDREAAIRFFADKGEKYKAQLIEDLPRDEQISLYSQGDWVDLCRGPHMRTTGDVGTAFKLMKVAGAYWRGDHRNAMLSRIYGTAWRDQKELDSHLHQLEEAERRDHRRIGKEMDLFHLQEEAAGAVFWHPNGWKLYRRTEDYLRRRLDASGYQEVKTPQLVDRVLWEKSGHWENYRQHMFIATVEDENKTLAVKPMNCPCHVLIFRQGLRSYRELPLRLAEMGSCHRYEPSGALHGIMRVRAFTQDDAHIFCTEAQIASETVRFVELLGSIYRDFGFESFRIKLADRPDHRIGSDAVWDHAEGALKEACATAGVEYTLNPGEGAFYGPKLEFVLRDAIGRDWQCGTLQVDFNTPGRLDAEYVGEDGARHVPVMLHRAILGSFERFLGIVIEHYAGRFPLWLAPVQVVVATIVSDANDYASEAAAAFAKVGLAVETDLTNQKINAKVREHSLAHVPVLAVVGRKEAENRTVALRRLGAPVQEVVPLAEAAARLAREATPPDLRQTAGETVLT